MLTKPCDSCYTCARTHAHTLTHNDAPWHRHPVGRHSQHSHRTHLTLPRLPTEYVNIPITYIHSLSLDTLSLTKSSIPFRPLKARSASCVDFSVFFRSRHVRKSNIGERTGSTVTKNTYTLRTELSTVVTLPLAAPHDGHCHTLEGAARATSMALTMLTQITQS